MKLWCNWYNVLCLKNKEPQQKDTETERNAICECVWKLKRIPFKHTKRYDMNCWEQQKTYLCTTDAIERHTRSQYTRTHRGGDILSQRQIDLGCSMQHVVASPFAKSHRPLHQTRTIRLLALGRIHETNKLRFRFGEIFDFTETFLRPTGTNGFQTEMSHFE